ncbi:PIN domain-containing protein [Ornithinimicrobium sp. Y1847]|uniref:PIN domain-containing protein n=1 Tax=Ornithinimicrobium sp. Y1847 TaxID=3405419 RepID=UPI003B673786
MIGLDTTVVVRHLVQDHAEQGAAATRAMAKLTPQEPGFLTTVVVVETYWVLTRGYKIAAETVIGALSALVDSPDIVVQDESQVRSALRLARSGSDFADAVISAACTSRGCSQVLSFDRRAQRDVGFTQP